MSYNLESNQLIPPTEMLDGVLTEANVITFLRAGYTSAAIMQVVPTLTRRKLENLTRSVSYNMLTRPTQPMRQIEVSVKTHRLIRQLSGEHGYKRIDDFINALLTELIDSPQFEQRRQTLLNLKGREFKTNRELRALQKKASNLDAK